VRRNATLATAATAASVAWTLPALAPLVPSLCRSLRVVRTIDPTEPVVALTFDDGPHPEGTPLVLDVLAERGQHATFFLVGEQVRRWPHLAARIAREGHAIALHGDRHRNLLRIPPGVLARDLDRGHREIAAATGVTPTLYRPPYGIFSPAGLAIARTRGWTPTLWSRWGRDWRGSATAAGIAAKVTEDLRAGDVLLLHDADHYSAAGSWRQTAAALPLVLDELERRGLRSTAL
jgi:peptidoglycan/xylan/chitin deacetylase (PgdA/CDA1 family)